MLNHIESSHVNGVFHKCSECSVRFKTRGGLSTHKVKIHKQTKKDDLKADEGREDDDKVDGENDSSLTETNSQNTELTNNISGTEETSNAWDMEQ